MSDHSPLTLEPTTLPLYRVFAAAVGVRITRFLLRTAGFHRTIVWLGAIPPLADTVDDVDPVWAHEIAFASRWRYGASCLDRSVFLWFILRQHSIDGDLRIGVSTTDDDIGGHAWVEHRGSVLPDIADSFAVFKDDPVGIVFR